MQNRLFTALVTLIAVLTPVVTAGKGAQVNACVHLHTFKGQAQLEFRVGSPIDHCMNSVGHDNSMLLQGAGVTCVGIGYVEAKETTSNGDNCLVQDSHWGIQMNLGNWVGFARTYWDSQKGLVLQKNSGGTIVCERDTNCQSREQQDWFGVGPLFIIFQPESDWTNDGIPYVNPPAE